MKKTNNFCLLVIMLSLLILLSAESKAEKITSCKEIFDDPSFSKGVAVGYGNTYPQSQDLICIQRWKQILPDYYKIKWMFTEISERFYFCEPDSTSTGAPTIGTNFINYFGPNYGYNGYKTFTSDRSGTIQMKYDTGWEWRGGCNLCKLWTGVDPNPPKYGNAYTNWPHFLIGQILSPNYIPSQNPPSLTSIPLADRVNLTKYNKLQFTGQFKLNEILKKSINECPFGDWTPQVTNNGIMTFDPCTQTCGPETQTCSDVPDHAVFYVAFVLWRNNWNENPPSNVPNVIYQLLPLVYSEDGVTNIGGSTSYVMGDQFGDRTYFAKLGEGVTANAKKLTESSQTFETIDIDVSAFSTQVLKEINPALNPSDYFVSAFLGGWEIWGGYKTDIQMKDLSLIGCREFEKEDLNQDDKIDMQDIVIFSSGYLSAGPELDFNGDTKVNLNDMVIIAKKIVK